MSEEIIIDGVNVAGCRFLDEWKHCNICEELCDGKCLIVEDIECKTYNDCYYKQLQRAKDENERLEQLYQDNHCEVLRLQKGLKYIEKYTHSPIADTVRMGIIRNTIKELLNGN